MAFSKETMELAGHIQAAVAHDQTPEAGGCDISAGMFGPKMSELIQHLANQRDVRAYIGRVEQIVNAQSRGQAGVAHEMLSALLLEWRALK